MTPETHLGTLVTAWISYLTAVGMIYAIGQKAAEFLNEDTIHKVSEFSRERPITTSMNAILHVTLGSIDRLLGFRKDGFFYRPRVVRSVLVSLIMLALLLYPLRNQPALVIMYVGLTVGQLFGDFTALQQFSLVQFLIMFTVFLCFNALSDFLSFSKTRTLMESFSRFPSPLRVLTLLLLDVVLSVLIAYAVSAAPFLMVEYGAGPFLSIFETETLNTKLIMSTIILGIAFGSFLILRRFRLVTILFACLSFFPLIHLLLYLAFARTMDDLLASIFFPLIFTIGVFIFASVTGLGITVISALTAVVALIGWMASRIEAKGIWKILNFDKKPMESAAIVAIVVFTFVYWPVVLF